MQETWVRSLGWEDPLEEGMAIHSSILVWRIPMDRGAWRTIGHWGHKELDTTEQLNTEPRNFAYPAPLRAIPCLREQEKLFSCVCLPQA